MAPVSPVPDEAAGVLLSAELAALSLQAVKPANMVKARIIFFMISI
jgi:hypothetical protein